MMNGYGITFFLVLACLIAVFDASPGDADSLYRVCVEQCVKSGCVKERCFPHCNFSSEGVSVDGPWYTQERLYLQWKQWGCQSDCRYYCMLDRESEREVLGSGPVKYHGKWPFKRVYGLQEPVSVALSALNLVMHLHGWLSLFKVDNTKYAYASLWHIYGLLSMNSWFWSSVFHSRDLYVTEMLDYSSAVALLGFSLILSMIRCFSVTYEAARVMIAAPLGAFVSTHILYLHMYKLDYGWNMKVCVIMGVAQLLTWAIWAGVSRHPSRWKVWLVVVGGGLAMLLEIYDFPPYQGFVDAHALWHATTVPLTYIWWSFIRDDAIFQTSGLLKKAN